MDSPKKYLTKLNAVKAAGQRAVLPDLHAVSVTKLMQSAIGLDHVLTDPGAGFALARGGAGAHDCFKVAVEGDGEIRLTKMTGQAAADMQLFEPDHTAGRRAPPQDGLGFCVVPGEDASGISPQKGLRVKIRPGSQQAVRVGEGEAGIGERLPQLPAMAPCGCPPVYQSFRLSRKRSASSAAMQPAPAEVTA